MPQAPGTSLLSPSPAASFWGTFKRLRELAFFVLWLLCLPFELIAHRRVGRRYHATLFFFLSLVLVGLLGVLMSPMGDLGVLSAHRGQAPTNANVVTAAAAHSTTVFAGFGCLASGAFFIHCWFNRKRFGTPDQLHSFDSGVPIVVYPPFADRLLTALGWHTLTRRAPGISFDQGGGTPEIRAYPSDGFFRNARIYVQKHLELLLSGKCPYGVLTWLTVAVLEPLLVGLAGIAILLLLPSYSGFGYYLVLLALTLRVKAGIQASVWLEWAYDERDHEHEIEARSNWRAGKSATELSDSFTVPVSRAVLVPDRQRRVEMPGPLLVGPEWTPPDVRTSGPAWAPPNQRINGPDWSSPDVRII